MFTTFLSYHTTFVSILVLQTAVRKRKETSNRQRDDGWRATRPENGLAITSGEWNGIKYGVCINFKKAELCFVYT
jgi:hypothetical protein